MTKDSNSRIKLRGFPMLVSYIMRRRADVGPGLIADAEIRALEQLS